MQSRDAVGRVVDGVAALLEVLGDHLGDVAMILDEQQRGGVGVGSQADSICLFTEPAGTRKTSCLRPLPRCILSTVVQ